MAILRSLSDEHRPIVPWLWYYEMANVLLIQVHRKRVVFEEMKAFLSLIGEMAIDIDAPGKLAIFKLPYLPREHGLTSLQLSRTLMS